MKPLLLPHAVAAGFWVTPNITDAIQQLGSLPKCRVVGPFPGFLYMYSTVLYILPLGPPSAEL